MILITNLDNFDNSKIYIKITPWANTIFTYSIDSSKQTNEEILITINSQFSSKHL